MGCLRVELAEREGHDPPELQLLLEEVGRGRLSAQPEHIKLGSCTLYICVDELRRQST